MARQIYLLVLRIGATTAGMEVSCSRPGCFEAGPIPGDGRRPEDTCTGTEGTTVPELSQSRDPLEPTRGAQRSDHHTRCSFATWGLALGRSSRVASGLIGPSTRLSARHHSRSALTSTAATYGELPQDDRGHCPDSCRDREFRSHI
jgi:hypothetical protein